MKVSYQDYSHPISFLFSTVIQDIQTMESIVWEAVMVDDCQSLRVSKCLEQLKHLSTNFRMVLLSFPLKVLLATVTCRIIFTLFPQTGNVNSFCFAGEYS